MDEAKKKLMEELKLKTKKTNREKKWKENEFLQDCILKVNGKAIISEDEEKQILNMFYSKITMTIAGHIDWEGIKGNRKVLTYEEYTNRIADNDLLYIIWSDYETPIIQCYTNKLKNAWNEIEAVAFDFWLITMDFSVIAESYKDGKLRVLTE